MSVSALLRACLFVIFLGVVCMPVVAEASDLSPREQARAAADEGAHDRALTILEQAYIESEDPAILFERVLVLEDMGETEMALELLEANEEDFRASPDVEGVTMVRQRLIDGDEYATASDEVKSGRRSDGVGWGLTIGGFSLAAGGLAAMISAQHQARRLRCSPDSTFDGNCEGVEDYGPMSPETYNERADRVRLTNALGMSAIAIGAGLGAWGIYRLAGPEGRPERAMIRLFVDPAGKRAGLKLLF